MEPDQIILNQLMKAIQTMGDRMTQLENSGLALPEGRHRVGETPRAGYVEPKPPDPSLIIPHQTSKTQSHIVHSYSDYGSAKKSKLYTFSGRRNYLEWDSLVCKTWFLSKPAGVQDLRLACIVPYFDLGCIFHNKFKQ